MAAILQQDTPHLRHLMLTGGASTNPTICQLSADLFGIPTYVAKDTSKAAATDGALLVRYAWWQSNGSPGVSFEEMRTGDTDSPKAVLNILQTQAQVFGKECRGNENLMDWLSPTVNKYPICFFIDACGRDRVGGHPHPLSDHSPTHEHLRLSHPPEQSLLVTPYLLARPLTPPSQLKLLPS